jgi:hypothetical protein
MRVYPATLLCLNDPYPKTGQVKGGHGQDQDQAVERFGKSTLSGRTVPVRASGHRVLTAETGWAEMDQGIAGPPQAKVPPLLVQEVKQPLMRKATIGKQGDHLACGHDSTHLVEHGKVGLQNGSVCCDGARLAMLQRWRDHDTPERHGSGQRG